MIKNADHYFGFIGTLLGGIFILLLFILVQDSVSSIYASVAAKEGDKHVSDAWVVSVATFASFLACSTLIFLIVRFKTKDFLHYLAIKAPLLSDLKIWLGITFLFLLLSHSIMYVMGKPFADEYAISLYSTADTLWFLLLAVIVIAPILEELLFRGYLFSGFSRSFLKPIGAALLTSALWGIVHPQYELYLIVIIFFQGIMLCLARVYTKSTITCMLMHMLINTFVVAKTVYYIEVISG